MITLYHIRGSRSCRVRWLLEELGLEYKLEPLSFRDGSLQSPAYLAKNPLAKVPTIEDDGEVLFESGAIVEYLLERYGGGRLAPKPGDPQRGKFLQWLHWCEATLCPPLGEIAQNAFMKPENERIAAVVPDAQKRLGKVLRVLEEELEQKDFLLGGEFSAADIMAGYALHLAKLLGQLGEEYPRLHAYLERLGARPAFQTGFGA